MDPRDNSVTFSPELFAHLGGFESCHKAYVFNIHGIADSYAFVINPEFDVETQIADVQVNTKTKEFGFESLTPSVVMMFVRNGLDIETPCKVPVREQKTLFSFGSFYEFDFGHAEVL